MKSLLSAALLLGTALATPLSVQAASGQINGFSASATTVTEGTLVDFSVDYSIATSLYQNGGSNPTPPAPEEGYQYWDINWYYYEGETLSQVWLQAGGESFAEYPGVPAGGSHSGTWTFSVLFPTQGTFDITLSGGWTSQVDYWYSNESASRECMNNDPGGTNELMCYWWTYEYYDYSDWYTTDGSFASPTLTIEVQAAAVPEPGTLALWLAGAALLVARRRHRAA